MDNFLSDVNRSNKTLRTIRCSSPVILYNPYLEPLILQHGGYCIKNRRYYIDKSWFVHIPYNLLSAKYNNIHNIEDVESSYIFDIETGETFPLYMMVPCGKCILCRDKKQLDWQARAMCETSTSRSIPYFITLTFNNDYLPEDKSIHKEDVQKFLKRLRWNLSYYGDTEYINYVAVGEYGSQKQRPHYHLILWNLPSSNWEIVKNMIEDAWQYGFVMVKPCDSGCIKYVMKYVRKDGNAPFGCTPPFFLSSRKYAIGKKWLQENKTWLLNNHATFFRVTDPFNNKTQAFGLPQYFVRKLYPTLSQLIPKEIRDAYRTMCIARNTLFHHADWYVEDFRYLYLQKKFSFLPQFNRDDITFFLQKGKVHLPDVVKHLEEDYYRNMALLLDYNLPDNILDILTNNLTRKDIINKLIENHPYTLENLFADEYKCQQSNLRRYRNELVSDVPF